MSNTYIPVWENGIEPLTRRGLKPPLLTNLYTLALNGEAADTGSQTPCSTN